MKVMKPLVTISEQLISHSWLSQFWKTNNHTRIITNITL